MRNSNLPPKPGVYEVQKHEQHKLEITSGGKCPHYRKMYMLIPEGEEKFQAVKEEKQVSLGSMESLEMEEVDRARDKTGRLEELGPGGEGERSPAEEMKTDKDVGDDRKVSKLIYLRITVVGKGSDLS